MDEKQYSYENELNRLITNMPFKTNGFVICMERAENLVSYLRDLNYSTKPDEWTSLTSEVRTFKFKRQAAQTQAMLEKLGYHKTKISSTEELNDKASQRWR